LLIAAARNVRFPSVSRPLGYTAVGDTTDAIADKTLMWLTGQRNRRFAMSKRAASPANPKPSQTGATAPQSHVKPAAIIFVVFDATPQGTCLQTHLSLP